MGVKAGRFLLREVPMLLELELALALALAGGSAP
jgi:hypothetical protein